MTQFSISNPVHFLALGFGSGLIRPAPGTWGTLAAVPVYLLFVYFNSFGLLGFLTMVLIAFVLGVYLCGKTASDVGVHDHSAIVWDEFVGFFITMIAVPPTLSNIVIGFLLFRLFDIFKPWPISWLDKKVSGGFGIMIDDVIAGLAAAAVIYVAGMLVA